MFASETWGSVAEEKPKIKNEKWDGIHREDVHHRERFLRVFLEIKHGDQGESGRVQDGMDGECPSQLVSNGALVVITKECFSIRRFRKPLP